VADHFEWWMKRTGLTPDAHEGYEKYVYEGGDMVQVLVDGCRKHGMAPMVSYRVNDVHLLEHVGERTPGSIRVSRFYAEHPEWWLDPDQKGKSGYYSWRGMDWVHPEVREYKLGLIGELCGSYDLAGIELDFLRDNHIFHPERTTLDQRAEIVTDFVRRVREALDGRRVPGVGRRWLCVRIPSALEALGDIGLDLEGLWAAGVDMFNLSTWYHTPFRTDVAQVRRRLPGAALYVELTHCTGGHEYFLHPGGYSTAGYPRCSDAELCTAARLAHARGADGVSLFNFVYYRQHGPDAGIPITEPPFHLLPVLADPAALSRRRQHYTLARTAYKAQVPCKLEPDQTHTLLFDLATSATGAARLRLHFREPPAEQVVSVRFNGEPAEPCDDVSRIYGNPFDCMVSPLTHRRAFSVPRAALHDGDNRVAVTLHTGQAAELIYADLCFE
jgi:hypothetical protein